MVLVYTPLQVEAVTDENKQPWHKYLKGQWSKNNQPLNPYASLPAAAEYVKFVTEHMAVLCTNKLLTDIFLKMYCNSNNKN